MQRDFSLPEHVHVKQDCKYVLFTTPQIWAEIQQDQLGQPRRCHGNAQVCVLQPACQRSTLESEERWAYLKAQRAKRAVDLSSAFRDSIHNVQRFMQHMVGKVAMVVDLVLSKEAILTNKVLAK